MSIGGSGSSGSSTTTIDPTFKAAWQALDTLAQTTGASLTGKDPHQTVAAQSADTAAADNLLKQQIATSGNNGPDNMLLQSDKAALGASNYTPTQVNATTLTPAQAQASQAVGTNLGNAQGYNPATIGNAPGYNSVDANAQGFNAVDANSQGYNAATIDPSKVGTVDAGRLPDVNLKAYENPYQKDVIDSTTADWQHALKLQQQDDKASAINAHAFGGDREGVQRGETETGADRTLASTLAGLNSQDYTQAAANAETDLSRGLQADATNQGTALTEQTSDQASKNAANAFTAGAGNTAQLANSAADTAARAATAQAGTTVSLANAANATAAKRDSANADLTAALADQGATNTAKGFTAQAQNTFDAQTAANKQAAALQNSQLGTSTAVSNAAQANSVGQGNQATGLAAQTSNQGAGLTANGQAITASGQLANDATALEGINTQDLTNLNTQGQINQTQAQNVANATYANSLADYQNLLAPLQTQETAFGIMPGTSQGSSTNSTAKSAAGGFGG